MVLVSEDGRLEYIRDDLKTLTEKMDKGFFQMSKKIENSNSQFYQHCVGKREEILREIKENNERIEVNKETTQELRRIMFKFSLIGAGVGYILGYFTPLLLENII